MSAYSIPNNFHKLPGCREVPVGGQFVHHERHVYWDRIYIANDGSHMNVTMVPNEHGWTLSSWRVEMAAGKSVGRIRSRGPVAET